jgi:hypothetical protein
VNRDLDNLDGIEPACRGDPNPAGLLVGLVVGIPLMIVGLLGLLHHLDATPPSSYLRFFIGGDLLNDFVVLPIAALVGVLVLRRVPEIGRGPLRGALFTSAIVVAVAWPALRGYGRMRAPDNISVQPLNYATAVGAVLVVVWVGAAIWFVIALIRARR